MVYTLSYIPHPYCFLLRITEFQGLMKLVISTLRRRVALWITVECALGLGGLYPFCGDWVIPEELVDSVV